MILLFGRLYRLPLRDMLAKTKIILLLGTNLLTRRKQESTYIDESV